MDHYYYFIIFYLYFFCLDFGVNGFSYRFRDTNKSELRCLLLKNSTKALSYPWIVSAATDKVMGHATQYLRTETSCMQLELFIHPKGLLWVTVAVLIEPKSISVMIYEGNLKLHQEDLIYNEKRLGLSQNLTMIIPDKIRKGLYSILFISKQDKKINQGYIVLESINYTPPGGLNGSRTLKGLKREERFAGNFRSHEGSEHRETLETLENSDSGKAIQSDRKSPSPSTGFRGFSDFGSSKSYKTHKTSHWEAIKVALLFLASFILLSTVYVLYMWKLRSALRLV